MSRNLRMPILNSAQFSGNLVRDPELKTIERPQGQTNVAKFTIAVTESFVKDEAGQLKVFFLTCKAFGQLADRVSEFRKGDPLIVSGPLREEKWVGQDKIEKKALVLSVREAHCIAWPPDSTGGEHAGYRTPSPSAPAESAQQGSIPGSEPAARLPFDDDFPF